MAMEHVIEFLSLVRVNNNREWFAANKSLYKEALEEFNAFAEKVISLTGMFDESVRGLSLKDCTYRIYRDTRFSLDKSPYKTHMGVFVAPRGKKSGYAGYYFHIEPRSEFFEGASMFSCGMYLPQPAVLRSIREEILDNGGEIVKAIRRAKGFELFEQDKLKRTPMGFPSGTEYDELLKLKNIMLDRSVDNDFLTAPDLAERVAEEFKATTPFIAILNRATRYAFEEMTK